MSGPKVVIVLTREERMAEALRLLTTLRSAITRYESLCADDAHESTQQELQTVRARFEELTQSVQQADHFYALENSLRAAIDRLRVEIAFVQENRERTQQAQFEKRSQTRLRQYAQQYMQAHLQETIAQQRTRYADEQGAKALTETQQALLQQMREASDEPQAVAWEATLAAIPESVSRLERTMAALEQLHPALAERFNARLAGLHAQSHDPRSMARDTLYLELAEAVKAQQEIQQAIEALEDVAAQAELPPPVMAAIERTIMARNLTSLRRLHDQIDARLKAQEAETFARLRREALLLGLAELGYTAGEDMVTLLEKEGRIVLRKDASYGIELAGSASSPRMQLRVVSFSDREDAEADREAESIWCSEVQSLQEKARASGMDIVLEVAKEPGEVPVKKVERRHSEQTRPVQMKRPLFQAK